MYYNSLQEETLYRTLVESLSQGLVIFQDSRIVFANAAETELTGYSIEELLAMTSEQMVAMIHPDQRGWVIAHLQDQPAGNPISTHAEIQLIRKDSTSRWVEIHVKSFEYQGKPALQIMTLDIAERKQMEAARVETENLQRALDQEREVKELKGRFISMVSHLFRTPLSVISTTGYLLENYNDKLPQEKRQEYFGKIRSQIDRLDELIENVLTISQHQAKMIAFAPNPIDLDACCRDIVAEMQLTSPTLHQMSFTADGDFSAAMVDDKLLRNILMNLLSNAIKYSPDGGEVQVKLTRHGDEAIFEISDSGIGILAEDQKHLFEPFHRGQNIAGIKGSGLGLKIAKDFVDGHGGTISCVSEVGKGTTFTVRLPIVQDEMQTEIHGVDDPTLSSGGA